MRPDLGGGERVVIQIDQLEADLAPQVRRRAPAPLALRGWSVLT
jgi:hypothetical protein